VLFKAPCLRDPESTSEPFWASWSRRRRRRRRRRRIHLLATHKRWRTK